MRLTKMLSAAVCLLAAGVALGQTTKPAVAPVPAGAILEQIPAGSMGFIVVPDVRSRAAQVDKFMEQIGQGSAYKASEVKGLLEYVCKEAKLDEGFNPDGGFAAVMLDMQQFGIDASSLMSGHDKNGDPLKPPYVVIVPGASIDSVFGQYERSTPAGAKHVQVKLRMGEMFAAASNGYVLLSPREDALDAALQAKQNAAGELIAEQVKLIRSSAMALYVNMKVSGPLMIKMLKQWEDIMAAMGAMSGGNAGYEGMYTAVLGRVMPFSRQAISQMECVLMGVKFTDVGPAITVRFTFVKDSEMAKSLCAAKAIQTSMLSRLPNLDYIFAMETSGAEMTDERAKAIGNQVDKMLAEKFMADVPDASKARIKKLALDWNEQVQGMQLVFGGAPKDKGIFAMAMVLQCKDSKKTKDLLAEGTDLVSEVVLKKLTGLMTPPEGPKETPPANQGTTPFAPPVAGAGDNAAPAANTPATGPAATEPAEPPVKIAYKKDVTKSGATSVDAIVITAPQLSEHGKELVKYLGDEQVRVLVAAPTDKLVVVTFGGAEDMMTAALKTASDNSGGIVGKETQAVLDQLPKQRTVLALLDLSNMFKIGKLASEDKTTPTIETHAPAAFTLNIADNTIEDFFLIPNDMIKDIVKAIEAMRPGGPSSEEPPGTEKPKKPHEDF
jgi:hypothetical protein